ncbi:acyltransferase family protein [Aeromicrobium phoceense]|uniref:acyltransferase family protein n=1 Tax=Aeromicrobium phoceense TaxID=2754045 RepID=UPI0028B09082|nr:acyltransferase family protein [Aeromicrobium phoceense]
MAVTARTTSRISSLDGLRGIAMVIFLLFHVGVPGLGGAWTGLSLFFVMSAYLITLLLLRERDRFGRMDVVAFYRRRARRLLPALFVLLAVVGTWGLLFADDLARRGLRGDMLASLGFVMNWRLVGEADQYFSTFGQPSVLRHLWTLSVEEQFYLCLPLLLVVLFLLPPRLAIPLLAAGAVASAWWTAQIGLGDASAVAHSYYGTDTRAQSLLGGMIAAFVHHAWRSGPPSALRRAGPALAWVGVVACGAFVVLVEPMDPFMFGQGGLLLQAFVVGLLLLLLAHGIAGSAGRFLGWAPFAYLGVRSYGIYLYHWPITLWLDQAFPGTPLWVAVPVVLGLSVLIAAASYRWLEEPVIRGGLRALVPARRRPRLVAVAAPVLVVALAVQVGNVGASASEMDGRAVDVPALSDDDPAYKPKDRPTRVALYGDSVAQNLVTYFPTANHPDLLVGSVAVPGCDLVDLTPAWNRELGGAPTAECRDSRTNLGERLRDLDADTVVLVTGSLLSIPHHVEGDDGPVWWLQDAPYRAAVESALDGLLAQADESGVSTQIATIPCRIDGREGHAEALRAYLEAHPEVAEATSDPTVVNTWIREWAQSRDVAVLDLYDALGCSEGFRPVIKGVTLYADQLHFSDAGAAMVWTWLAPRVRAQAAGSPAR